MDKWKKTSKLITCGVQTLSKMPSKYVEGVYPKYIEYADGCYVYDNKANRYIDYPCALGAITLGYNHPDINKAVKVQIEQGVLYSLPNYLETELAELLVKLIPCAEQVRFLKTGSEATSAAVKIARSYTGKEHVLCCGYHGWHDWYTITTQKNKGIPSSYGILVHPFEYNDLNSFKTLLRRFKDKIACVIMEPYVFQEPETSFLEEIKFLTHQSKALLIFDEIITGFRSPCLSAQRWLAITPDLATFSKGMANGFSISCVVGKRRYMKELEGNCFLSSTFGGDLVGISAAKATIEFMLKEDVIRHIWKMGTNLHEGYNEITEKLKINTKCVGFPIRTYFEFPTEGHKSLFWQECLLKGVFLGYAQFISYAHKEEDINYTLNVMEKALKIVKKHWKDPLKALKGKQAQETFRLYVYSNNTSKNKVRKTAR